MAVPVIGTGNLAFQIDRVAKVLFDEILAYDAVRPMSTLKQVNIVIFNRDLEAARTLAIELLNRADNLRLFSSITVRK